MVVDVLSFLFAWIALLGRAAISFSPQNRGSSAAGDGRGSIEEWFPRDPISMLASIGGEKNLVGYFPFDSDDLVNYILPSVQEG
jgi:hypothetical protein